jgi:mitochondrial import inner membrane translocase subunit TIM17
LFSPWRILEDAGGAFAMGGIGGSLWHGIKGFKNSPRVKIILICIHK